MCYSVCWETVEGELCLLEAIRCVLLCMMEAVELNAAKLQLSSVYIEHCTPAGGCARFRVFEISIVAVFSLQSATSFIE